jgi:DNA-binding NarL/FixJ family response regulator
MKVMLVDDHTPFRRTAKALLEEQDLEVVIVDEETQAVEAVRRDHPDVLLIDVGLASGTGMQLAELIALEPDAPRIILIAEWELEDLGGVQLPQAVDGFITKNKLGRAAIEEVLR